MALFQRSKFLIIHDQTAAISISAHSKCHRMKKNFNTVKIHLKVSQISTEGLVSPVMVTLEDYFDKEEMTARSS